MDSRRGLTTAIALLAVVLGACTITGEDYETDTPVAKRLQERLERFSREGPDGKRRRLADMTDFAWDTVYHFGGNDRYERVDAVGGTGGLTRSTFPTCDDRAPGHAPDRSAREPLPRAPYERPQ